MSKEDNATPYADDMLKPDRGTTPEDIQAFVRRRATTPERVAGLTIWNFNNHKLNHEALRKQSDEFQRDEYLIPFQVSGVWGYMFHILPKRLKEVEILTYRRSEGIYVPYPNYYRHSRPNDNIRLENEITSWMTDEKL